MTLPPRARACGAVFYFSARAAAPPRTQPTADARTSRERQALSIATADVRPVSLKPSRA